MANIKVTATAIEGLFIIEPQVFGDHRGYFMETYHEQVFHDAGLTMNFVQDNQSKSMRGVLRGLHLQTQFAQGKLVRALMGEVYDVAVDLRAGSPTYGQYVGVVLSQDNHRMFYVPKGFAHGYLTLSEEAIFSYKCSDYYHPEFESGIIYNDPDVGVQWPIAASEILLSQKDNLLPTLKESGYQFTG